MRIYINVDEAFEEIKRDLKEMGTLVYPQTMQNKNIEGNQDYATRELQNYSYQLLNPWSSLVPGVSQPWADKEFMERMNSSKLNPGTAWLERKEIWQEFINDKGEFDYTYSERLFLSNQLENIIDRIKKDPESRQLWLSIWSPQLDNPNIGGIARVPCSLGYNFQVRNGWLEMHYIMRSCDFATHFKNDVYLAIRLLEEVSHRTGYPIYSFTHTMFSLHIYNKDVVEVF